VHRIGRTARMGAEGNAIVFLLPNEETYIDFLGHRKVPISEMEPFTDVPDIIEQIKCEIRKDRQLLEKSQLAFVSYIRAYKEHHCNYIFMLKDLNIPEVLKSFAMLKIPKMAELKMTIDYPEEDINNIPYLDKAREKKRKERLANYAKHQEIKDLKKKKKTTKMG